MRVVTAVVPTMVLLALLFARELRADEDVNAPSDIRQDIAWARATWPDTFRGARFHSPLPKLVAWVPVGGAIPVYLYTEDFACRPASLQRGQVEHNLVHGDVALTAKITGPVRIESGKRVRNVIYVSVGEELWREEEDIIESKGADGRWRMASSSGYGLESEYGALSYVDDRIARFDGERLVIHPFCAGPVEWLSCASGGERPCLRCDLVHVTLTPSLSLFGHGVDHGNRPVTCSDPCPPHESSDIARLKHLEAQVSLWRPSKGALTATPGLYKSRDDCLRDHPQLIRAHDGPP